MKLLSKAIYIASKAHLGVLDRGGKPYILHPIWIMNQVRHLGWEAMCVAILHDVVEDTDWTLERLTEEGFTAQILFSLNLLTHDKDKLTYEEYIKRIANSKDKIAIAVKKKDLEHNSSVTRLKGLRRRDMERLEKYSWAYTYLSD